MPRVVSYNDDASESYAVYECNVCVAVLGASTRF